MSATNRGALRVENDHYETPLEHARAVFELLPAAPMLDPCCGRGNILQAATEHGCPSVTGIEIDPKLAAFAEVHGHSVLIGDALANPWPDGIVIVVMNPPFIDELAIAFIRKAIEHVRPLGGSVAALMRANWVAPAARDELFAEIGVPDLHPMDRRPSFCMAVRCKSKQANIETGKTCDWRGTFLLDHPRPKACPQCGSDDITINTSDATEYAWLIWSTQAGIQTEGRWSRLKVAKRERPKRAPALAVAAARA